MGYLEFCSNCGSKNQQGYKDGNIRYFCSKCKLIHYENPKPTATLICICKNQLLLVKRAKAPAKGKWGLPGGFIEMNETPEEGGLRELLEETNLHGKSPQILGTCSHYNTMFGDILLIGMVVKVDNWENMRAGDDAEEARLFPIKKLPDIAFICHRKIIEMYQKSL
jgi:ADP-ribose pyrophosphatase YjhB (NUDIX family)